MGTLFVAVDVAVGERGDGATGEVGDEVDRELGEFFEAHDVDAETDGGVEGAARNAPDGDRADEDSETDREAVEGVVERAFGRGGVQDDPGERESEEKLDQERGAGGVRSGTESGFAGEGDDHQRGDEAGEELGDQVGREVFLVVTTAEEDGDGDGGVEMAARDVSAGENHDHERGADRERGEVAAAVNRQTNREHEEERADELDEVFFHNEVEAGGMSDRECVGKRGGGGCAATGWREGDGKAMETWAMGDGGL